MATNLSGKTYPINEIYGPVYQGEGPQIGLKTWFVRFAGCDYDCSWCDTKYAVSPKYPGWSRVMRTSREVADTLSELNAKSEDWITLSGGNPALFVDDDFVSVLRGAGLNLAMETQGSVGLKPMVSSYIASLVVSPKPPSSGMDERLNYLALTRLLTEGRAIRQTSLKYVIFDEDDLEWVKHLEHKLPALLSVQRFLMVGTNIEPNEDVIGPILARMRWLMDLAKDDPQLKNFRILAQQHALLYGLKRGV